MCKRTTMSNKHNNINQDLQEIRDIFKSCQATTAVHQRNSAILKEIYDQSNREEFWNCLKNIITTLLVQKLGNIYVEKMIKFLGLFCSLLKSSSVENVEENESVDIEEHPLLKEIIAYLLKASKVQKDIIRIRSCQIINVILDNLVGEDLSYDLCNDLENDILDRLADPKLPVRHQAVLTLYRLQDPKDPNDNIISQLISLMNSDAQPKVRRVCLEKIAIRKDVIQHIIMRSRDVDKSVRLAAFKRLSKFPLYLKISGRCQILHCGFTDESEEIRNFMSVLINSWMQAYDNNILTFMTSLRLDADQKDVDNTEELFERVLNELFKNSPVGRFSQTLTVNDKLIPLKELNWETVSFWRIYVQFLSRGNDLEEELEKMVPELVTFCDYIKSFYTNMPVDKTTEEFLEEQYILKQLFLMTKTYDFDDIVNRNCLNSLVTDTLKNVTLTTDVVEKIISVLDRSIPDINERVLHICEMVSNILYPMDADEDDNKKREQEYQIACIKVEISELQDLKEKAVRNEDFAEAERIKQELLRLNARLESNKSSDVESGQLAKPKQRMDSITVVKCLDIVAATLLSPKVEKLTAPLMAWKVDVVQELLICDNLTLRAKALRCFALFATIDKPTACAGIHIFSKPIFDYENEDECDTQTLLICMSAVVDLLRVYGPELIAVPESGVLSESMEERQQAVFTGGTCLTAVLQGFVNLMDDDQTEIQEKAALGLCQLVLSNRIVSGSIISRLILKWCNPATDSECVKQIIGYMLERLPALTCTDQLIDATFMTLDALHSAPRTNPLAEVNVENIAKFLFSLCKTSTKSDYIHSTIALRLIKEMIEKPRSKVNKQLSKMLLFLDIPNDETPLEELLMCCCTLNEDLRERLVINNITKLITKLNLKVLESNRKKSTNQTQCETETVEGTIAEEGEVCDSDITKEKSNRTVRRIQNGFDEYAETSDEDNDESDSSTDETVFSEE